MSLSAKAEAYIQEALGVGCQLSPAQLPQLPYFLQDAYEFFQASLLGLPCLFFLPKVPDEPTGMLEKHCQQLEKAVPDAGVIYLAETMPAHLRQRLARHRINFMVPGNQLHIPVLGVSLREYYRQKRVQRKPEAALSPTAQLMVLWALLKEPLEGWNCAQMAERLGCSRMSAARACDELAAFPWTKVEKMGRNEKRLTFLIRGKALWEVAQDKMQSPVRKVRWVRERRQLLQGISAGESALAHYTLLGEPENPVVAVAAEEWRRLCGEWHLEEIDHEAPNSIQVQTWRYSPAVFAEGGNTDRLSLYLSLVNEVDPRICKARETLLEEITW
jgi:hypothetical protein